LGLLFNKIDLILEVIARGIARKKKTHKRYIYSIIDILESIYRQKILPVNGMRLVLSGKIDSKTRKKYINYTRGTLGLQTLSSKLLYSILHYDTRFGVISLRF
jgi:ribosomal protein S3